MRVIAGKAKGRRLKSVPGEGTRPITDRAKSALFSIIGSDIVGVRFLDLFAGTGQVGIEALSRGASLATFVDCDGRAIRLVRANLRALELDRQGDVFRLPFDLFVKQRQASMPFDVVFVDPPFDSGLAAEACLWTARPSPWARFSHNRRARPE